MGDDGNGNRGGLEVTLRERKRNWRMGNGTWRGRERDLERTKTGLLTGKNK